MPVIVIKLHMVATIIVARPARLLAQQGVMGHRLGTDQSMLQFPRALLLVQVFRANVLQVFPQRLQLIESTRQQWLVGRVTGADAADVNHLRIGPT